MYECSAYVYVCSCLVPININRGWQMSQELEVWIYVSHHLGHQKSNKISKLLSHLLSSDNVIIDYLF